MPLARNQIFGIDFSGAQAPCKSIWITEARQEEDNLIVINCCAADDRFDLASNAPRRKVYEKLRILIKDHPTAVFGFDFPFSLPKSVIGKVDSWPEHLNALQEQFGDCSAEDFRQACVERAETGRKSFLRRETDWRYGGQCPYQPQIQSQTFFGQRDLLRPLITEEYACALPMQEPVPDLPWLIEVYPAATLGVLQLYRQGYKNHLNSPERREHNVNGFRDHGITIDEKLTDVCRQSDDALDSITAAVGTFHALNAGFPKHETSLDIEGQIFA